MSCCLMGYRRGLAHRILETSRVSVVFLLIGTTDAHLANEILGRNCCFVTMDDTAAEDSR